jgi:signal peptidase
MEAKNNGQIQSNLLKRVFSVIGNIIFVFCIILIAFLLFSMIQSKSSGGPPSILGYQMYIVAGGSMSPTFDAGSLAILESVEPQDIEVGDVITYKAPNEKLATTHRVMKVHNEEGQISFTTRGDANDVDDANPVPAGHVVGRVIYTVPYLGLLMDFSQTKKGLLILVIIPGTLLIISELRNLIKHAEQSDKKKTDKSAEEI